MIKVAIMSATCNHSSGHFSELTLIMSKQHRKVGWREHAGKNQVAEAQESGLEEARRQQSSQKSTEKWTGDSKKKTILSLTHMKVGRREQADHNQVAEARRIGKERACRQPQVNKEH